MWLVILSRFSNSTGLCRLFGAALFTLITTMANAKEPTVVRHYDKGFSPLFRVYLTDVLRTALDKTVPDYGPYQIEFYSQNLSTNRAKIETERGAILDVLFSTHWLGNSVDQHKVVRVDLPIFEGMLGLRSLIAREEVSLKLSALKEHQEFLHYRAGLGASWTDIGIFKANGIDVVEAQLFDGLFPMLARDRYDYLPLSVLEAQTALQTKGMPYGNLVVNDDVLLFYAMPFYLYVNGARPKLAERLQRGVAIAISDGTIERLFEQHFFYLDPILASGAKKLIVLQNPYLSTVDNARFLDHFLADYRHLFKEIQR